MTDSYNRYLKTYAGQALLKKYSLDDSGLWEVRGEDPNCDLGGGHYMPKLGVYEGTLRDVIEIAVDLPSFWQWGAGGDITLLSVKKVTPDSSKRIRELNARKKLLEEELKQIDDELEEY